MGFRLPKTKGMLRREAASWLARLQSGRDPDIKRKFQNWYADPAHAAAFDRVRHTYEQAGLLRQSPALTSSVPDRALQKAQWQPRPALAAAAAVAALVPIGLILFRGDMSPFGRTEVLMLMTRVGEIKQVKLSDGSKVTLDTSTRVEVEIGRSHRWAHLQYGRARFQVAQAREPFVVETGSTTITTQGGVVDVEQVAQGSRVHVLTGAAAVRGSNGRGESAVALAAGEGVTVKSAGAEQKQMVTQGPDWTRGMLQFDGTLLSDAVALANRYSGRHIIIAGDVASLRVTGAVRAGDTIGFAKALAAAFNLSLQQRGGNLILSRSGSPSLQNKKRG